MHVNVQGPAGPLEALLDEPGPHRKVTDPPAKVRAAVVFAHPHPQKGGTMHTKAVFQAAKGLRRIGCAVLRFNFRGVGRSAGTFDAGAGERADFLAALGFVADRYPSTPIWAAGFSFGAWVALEVGAEDPRVSVLIGVAPPVSRPGYGFPATLASVKPKFFVQGDLDTVCPTRDLRAFYATLKEPKELVIVDGANHLFDGQTPEVGEALADLLGDFA